MKLLKKIFAIFITSLTLGLGSCNFLNVDEYFNDMIPLDTIFAKQEYLERYVWGISALLPNEGNMYNSSYGPYMTATDECMMSWRKSGYDGTFLQSDEITPFSNAYNNWDRYYQGIRKSNTVFTRINECKDLSAFNRREILGLVHYLRGYFYLQLLQLYGPIPLLPDTPLDVSAPLDELCFERNTYDECVDYICSDMEIAYEYLNPTRPSTEIARPTRYAAAAVISRLRLYAASTWYNGNTAYSDWKTSDGRNFISQSRDNRKWALSAEASLRIIESNQFELHTVLRDADGIAFEGGGLSEKVENEWGAPFPYGVGGIDPFRSYNDMFNGETPAAINRELISSMALGNATALSLPLLQGGYCGVNITQALIDAYRMNDGSDYKETSESFQVMSGEKSFSGYRLNAVGASNGSAKVVEMYNNREPRFYATVAFNESFWAATSITNTTEASMRTNLIVKYYKGQNGYKSPVNPEDYCITGYISRKYVYKEDSGLYGSIKGKTFPIFRYAETLLNYVEALNEIEGSHTVNDVTFTRDIDQMVFYFNMIRFRAGLPGITTADASNKKTMTDLIRRERMVEFAHEGRRYHDVRRWGIAQETDGAPVRGLNVELSVETQLDRETYYRPTIVNHKYAQRIFLQKMYFWPIPDAKLKLNPKLVQNPGW